MAKADPDLAPRAIPSTPESGVDENGLRWKELDYSGTRYRLREITVDEDDAAWDASQNPGGETFNARLASRLRLVSAIVSPPTTVEDIPAWPRQKLRALMGLFDELNTLPPASAEGKDSAPAS